MILQALYDYYQRNADLPRLGFETKAIPFVIEINASGELVQITDTRTLDGKKKVARNFVVPQGVKKTSGVASNLLWDNAEYVLRAVSTDKLAEMAKKSADKPRQYRERLREMRNEFISKIKALPEQSDAGLSAVLNFLASDFRQMKANRRRLKADPLWAEIVESNPVLTFRLNGDVELVCQRPAIRAMLVNAGSDGEKITCLIRGESDDFERLHASIKGVWGAQSSGANIISFNKEAFNSFGKAQGANSPVGKQAAFAYTTALNYLLSKESTQRIQVGDASTVFWSEKRTNSEECTNFEGNFADFFAEPPKDDPAKQTRAIASLLTAVQAGAFNDEGQKTRFYVLGLAPNAARISVRFWQVGTVAEMAQRVCQHFKDLEIVHAAFEKPHLSLFRLLVSTAMQGKSENIPPNLAGETMRAILAGLPYPQTLLAGAIRRIRAERDVTYPRAALIKACLNRQICYAVRSGGLTWTEVNDKEVDVSLDESNMKPAYRLGRLFAVLEKIQELAQPNINTTIRDRYYGAASSTPVTVFPTLLKLKNHHVSKLDEKGRKILYRAFDDNTPDNYIANICVGIPPDLPAHLNLLDQGRFAIGYYHQRQVFFTKSDKSTSESTTQGA